MYQLRIYTIADRKSAEAYFSTHWERHKKSLLKYGIQTEDVFIEAGTEGATRVVALVSYQGDDMAAADREYMASKEFASDMEGFDMSRILSVESCMLVKDVL